MEEVLRGFSPGKLFIQPVLSFPGAAKPFRSMSFITVIQITQPLSSCGHTSVLEAFLKRAMPDYLVRDTDLFSLVK